MFSHLLSISHPMLHRFFFFFGYFQGSSFDFNNLLTQCPGNTAVIYSLIVISQILYLRSLLLTIPSQCQWAKKSQAIVRMPKIVYIKLLHCFETGNRALNIVSINNQFITTPNIFILQLLPLRPEHTITITVIIFRNVSITVGMNIILTLCHYNKMEVLVIFSCPSVHGRGLTLEVRMGRLWSRKWL